MEWTKIIDFDFDISLSSIVFVFKIRVKDNDLYLWLLLGEIWLGVSYALVGGKKGVGHDVNEFHFFGGHSTFFAETP